MPSTTSSSVSAVFASSNVITPSLPTWATSSDDFTFLERRSMSLTTSATAKSTPRLRSIGFMPAATDFAPSRTIEAASTVAVVVPSPATLLDFEATSRTIWAPMFSNLSWSSISLATVTPSLVIRGAPKDLSSTTFDPWDRGSGGLAGGRRQGDDAHDVALLHDQEILAIDAHFGARPFSEQDPIAGLHFERDDLAALVASTRPGDDDLAFLRLFLCGIGDDDAALCLF